MMLYIFLCLCTITQLRYEGPCCGHRLCPHQIKREEGGQRAKSTIGEWEGVSYCLYPELKEK